MLALDPLSVFGLSYTMANKMLFNDILK